MRRPPWKTRAVIFISIATVSIPQVSGAIGKGTIERVDTYLTANVPQGLSASISIAKNGEMLLSKGYGFADRAQRVVNAPDTVFDIGSLTKQFTAAAILRLAEQKKLTLTDSLGKYFVNVPQDKQNITLHQLLTHSAGFPEYPANDFDAVTVEQYLGHVFSSKLEFAPGEKYSYSNVGYALLGFVIERVAGVSYEQYLSDSFFRPLKMQQTGWVLPKWDQAKIAHGYAFDCFDRGTSIERYQEIGVSPVLMGNGGINSTLVDLHRWLASLHDATILSPASVRTLFSPHIRLPDRRRTDRSDESYAYGWMVAKFARGAKAIFHSGDNGNFRATILLLPEDKVEIIYLSNNGDRSSFAVPFEVKNMLFDEKYSPRPVVPSPYRVVDEFVLEHPSSASDQLLNHYSARMGSGIAEKSLLNRLGLFYAREGKKNVQWGIELLKLNVQLFPDDGNLRDSLGEGYLIGDQPELAIESFRKALAIAPSPECRWCDNSRKKLRELDADLSTIQ